MRDGDTKWLQQTIEKLSSTPISPGTPIELKPVLKRMLNVLVPAWMAAANEESDKGADEAVVIGVTMQAFGFIICAMLSSASESNMITVKEVLESYLAAMLADLDDTKPEEKVTLH